MAKKTLNIGLVGYGFMGRTHAHAYHNAAQFFDLPLTPVLKAVCSRDVAKAKAFADNWGATIGETDWKELIANKDIDAIHIVTPNDSHAEIAIAAAKAGKMVLCEKPLALDGQQGAEMVKVIEKPKVPNTVWYNYRRVPAVTLAKQIIDSGKLGKHRIDTALSMVKNSAGQRQNGARFRPVRGSSKNGKHVPLPKARAMDCKDAGRTIRIFTSYARGDARAMHEMRQIAEVAKYEFCQNGVIIDIQFWADDELCAGDCWKPAIRNELMRADIIVELLSFKFLGSPFIRTFELPLALNRAHSGDASIFAVILENCPWRCAGLEPWHVAPLNGRPITDFSRTRNAWYQVYEMFRKVVSNLVSTGPSSPRTKAA